MEDEVYKKILLVLGIALVVFFLGWVFKDTILPWVNNLGFGEIVSSNSGNKVQLTSSCGDCGSGTFNLCGRDECHKLGTCYFTKTSAFKSD